MSDVAPSNPYQAADWLRSRHEWLDQLVTRVCGPDTGADLPHVWVEQIVDGFNDLHDTNERWAEYEASHPQPRDRDDDNAFYAWQDAGPQLETDAGRAIGPMSSGEKRILRLMTTLTRSSANELCRAAWTVEDVNLDDRGAAIVEDWISVVRAQLG